MCSSDLINSNIELINKYLKENSTLEIPEGVKNFDFSFNQYTNIKKIILERL